ncbi:MAG: hypothetical protein HS119_06625 [Flavobacteriales bacterium]|nr:hypothetical protein [Flavobacteriales bacterium]
MKKIKILVASLLLGGFTYGQTAPQGAPPVNNTNTQARSAWYRGGNFAGGPAGNNNIFGTMAGFNSPIYTYTNGIARIKLNGTFGGATPQYTIEGYGAAQGVNTSGYLLLGQDGQTQNGNPSLFNSKGAFSMLHLNGIQNTNGGGFVQEFGYRPWMQTGITFTGNNDLMYFGIRRLAAGQDLSELGVTWSDNSGNGFPGPDDFVFRFTSGGNGNTAISNNLSAENDLDGRHIARFAGTGELGLGNTFGTGNPMYVRPQSLMHMSLDLNKEVWLQITNQLGTDQTVDDGLRMGIEAGNNPTAFLRWQERTPFIIQTDWNNGAGGINNGERMRISSINAPGIPNPAGLPNNTTRVAISHMGNNPISVPRSLLHLGYNTGNGAPGTFITDGWRDWMDIGTFTNNGTDNMYVGLKNEGTDRFDAVINWGDNQVAGTTPNGPDNLRFIFTSTTTALPPGQGDPVSQSNDGLETARLEPTAASTMGTNYGMMGIGNFSPTGPNIAAQDVVDAKLDIDGDLRIRTVTQDTTLLQVLVIDSNDHNRVHWRSIDDLGGNVTADNGLSINPANNVQLGHLPGNTGGELIRNTEIPTNGYNITFPGGGTSGIDQFIIGNPLTTSAAKFQVWSESEDFSVIGINSVLGTQVSVGVRGQSLGGAIHNIGVQGISTSQSNQNVGIRGIAANGNNYNLAGDFDIPATTTLNNWGVHSEVVGSSSGRNVGGELNAIGVNNQQNYGVICRASSGNIN